MLPPMKTLNGVQTINHAVKRSKHLAMGVFRTTGSRPPSATTIRPNPPIIVKMWRLFTSGIFSKTPLKIAAKKNTSKGKAPRTIGFVGGPTRRTKSLHELMQESAAKPRNLRTPLRLPKQFITSSTTQEAALVTFREHPAAIAWFGLHPVIAVSFARNLVPPSLSTSVEFLSLGPTSDPSPVWRRKVMRVLDLGCGSGRESIRWGVTASDEVIGI